MALIEGDLAHRRYRRNCHEICHIVGLNKMGDTATTEAICINWKRQLGTIFFSSRPVCPRTKSFGCSIPWMMRPFWRCDPWTTRPLDDASLTDVYWFIGTDWPEAEFMNVSGHWGFCKYFFNHNEGGMVFFIRFLSFPLYSVQNWIVVIVRYCVSLKKSKSQGKVVEVTVNSKEENYWDFCLDFVQEFVLWCWDRLVRTVSVEAKPVMHLHCFASS